LCQPFGQERDLNLLERGGDHARALSGLQVEGAAARLADRPGDEAIRVLERIHPTSH